MGMSTDIRFPNLGIVIENVGTGIDIYGFHIAYYGIIIAIGMVFGYLITAWMAKRTKQNPDMYLDFAIWVIIISVICARLYYVAFSWEEFSQNPLSILNLRTGGLAIYGGIIGAVITAYVYCRIKKISFPVLCDTAVIGLLLGQVIGRWGNFFNREAFGKYTDGLFAMQVAASNVNNDYTCSLSVLAERYLNQPQAYENILEIRRKASIIGGIKYFQVTPTFLYESIWNLVLMILLILYTKRKRFDGEIMLLYLVGYGVGRLWIEGLRTDQLFLWGTTIPVSQMISLIVVLVAVGILLRRRIREKVKKNKRY